jgi:glycosyltransferase involved in cell wall biosynthesis
MSYQLSIITPVYNGAQFIEACINNVIAQNHPEAEHIIVDGGSTDGTVEIIERYAQSYHHIRYISERDNGQSDAMNKGVAMAQAKIIGFLNVDDFYEPEVFTKALKAFEHLPEPSFVVGNCNVLVDNDRLFRVKTSRFIAGVSNSFASRKSFGLFLSQIDP